jgi:excisionase family DNA binding protein
VSSNAHKPSGPARAQYCKHTRMSTRALADGGFLSVSQGAAFLAISKSRLYELLKADLISSARLGGKICIPRLALLEYAAARIQLGTIA